MNEYVTSFVNQALAAGMPQEKIAALLQKAEEISIRKTASTMRPEQLVSGLIKGAGLDVTASSIAYTNGILKEAFEQGANLGQALDLTKKALAKTQDNLQLMSKVAAIVEDKELGPWFEGFVGAAKQAGISQEEASITAINLINREKMAASQDAGAMFKQPTVQGGAGGPAAAPGGMPGGMPGGQPGGMPGGDPGAGDGEGAQLEKVLATLPPEQQQALIQKILAMISGGSGGPPGAGAPAGGPPMGGPQ